MNRASEICGTPKSIPNVHDGSTIREESKEQKKVFKDITTENFPNLLSNIDQYIQEAQQTPRRKNARRSRHIIMKVLKVKLRENLKSSKRKITSHLKEKTDS